MQVTARPSNILRQLKARANAGEIDAVDVLGQIYTNGVSNNGAWIVRPDWHAARRYLELGVDRGHPDSMLALANILSAHVRTFPRAELLYKRAFRRGQATAAFNLAVGYKRHGRHGEAYRWYSKAAVAGDENGLYESALAELYGLGTRRNVRSALHKLRKISRSNTPYYPSHLMQIDAILVIASVYEQGWFVKFDVKTSERWLEKAVALGSGIAKARLEPWVRHRDAR